MIAFLGLITLLLVAAPLVYLAGRLATRIEGAPILRHLPHTLTMLVVVAAWGIWAQAAGALPAGETFTYTAGRAALRFDGLTLLLAAVILALTTAVVLFSGSPLAGREGEEKYYAMLLAVSGVMIGLGSAADLFNLWLWFEAMAVSSYLLVTFDHEQPASLEAGVKYLVQSAAGSALVLLGIALVLAQTGTLDIAAVREWAAAGDAPSYLLLAAGAFFFIGFGVKIALVPLHTWLPDAHAQAPSGISALLSGIVIEAGLVALLRALTALAGVTPSWGVLLLAFGAANMLAGNLLALRQTQVKRLLAFSSVSHVGYMLLGLGIAVYSSEAAGAQGSFFHLLSHGLMKGLAFLAAGALLFALRGPADHRPLLIRDLDGASTRYPLIALALSLALLGLGGLPPLVGFMSKWQMFAAGLATHNLIIGGLVLFAALNSVLSLAYYAPLINAMFRRQLSPAVRQGQAVPAAMNTPLILLALAILILGLWPALVQPLTGAAGAALMAAFGG